MDRTITFLTKLETIIQQRIDDGDSQSYVNMLVSSGLDRILKKIGEEAGEVIIAAKNKDKTELTNEAADLLFHLMITLKDQNLSIQDVINVLEKRHKP